MSARIFIMQRSVLLLVVLLVTVTAAMGQHWKKLGSKSIDFRNANDSIVVDRRNGTDSKFKLGASGASIRISRLVLTFANGEQRRFNNGFTIEVGESTNEVDIGETKAAIKRVDFWYESRSFNAKKAKVTLYVLPFK